jgi:hypothetical protein
MPDRPEGPISDGAGMSRGPVTKRITTKPIMTERITTKHRKDTTYNDKRYKETKRITTTV